MRLATRIAHVIGACVILLGGTGSVAVAPDTGPDPGLIANIAAQVVQPPPPPEVPRARFSLEAPDQVEAGQPLRLRVVRDGRDGRAHSFNVRFEPDGLVQDKSLSAEIDDASDSWEGETTTLADPEGDGRHDLYVMISSPTDADISVGRAQIVVIEPPRPSTFIVEAPADAVQRGEAVVFTVTRTSGSGAESVFYNAVQGSESIASGALSFDDQNQSRQVPLRAYHACGDPLSVVLPDKENEPKDTAAFTSYLPVDCRPTIWDYIRDWWWTIPSALGLIWLFSKLWPKPKPIDELLSDQPPPDKAPPLPPPAISSDFAMENGDPGFLAGEPSLRMPEVRSSLSIAFGSSGCPDPLPVRESSNE